jgi:hypothetical protein
MNPWIAHVKAWAAKNGKNYAQAIKSPACKAAYKKKM